MDSFSRFVPLGQETSAISGQIPSQISANGSALHGSTYQGSGSNYHIISQSHSFGPLYH